MRLFIAAPGAPIASTLNMPRGQPYDGRISNYNKGSEMKHWMAVCAAALMATAISLAGNGRDEAADFVPGLPSGWSSKGVMPGDEIGVMRFRDRPRTELVIRKRHDSPPGQPLTLYQTIDATPWRGRTIVFTVHRYLQLSPEVMRRAGAAGITEASVECNGSQSGSNAHMQTVAQTRTGLEVHLRLKVADDATICSYGVTFMAEGALHLFRMGLQDSRVERETYLAKRWPEWITPPTPSTMFNVDADAAALTQPNLEFKQ